MIVKIFTGPTDYDLGKLYTKDENEYLIGVDKGAMYAVEFGLELDHAIGDFDSVTETELLVIERHSKTLDKYDKIKNYTDTYLAIKKALELSSDLIIIYGGLGKRLDHTIANLSLLKLGNVIMIDNTTMAYVLDPGKHEIENDYKYISFFALEDIHVLDLKGFKYELNKMALLVDDPLCISNEGSGSIEFVEGSLLVIQQNE